MKRAGCCGVSLGPSGVQARLPLVAPALALVLGGCVAPPSFNPVDWYHAQVGGEIALTRPPPPNADAPYPNLGTMPPRPPATNLAAQEQVASTLQTDRGSAQYANVAEPIPTLPPPAERPAPPPVAAAGSDDEQPNASLQAANAPPPPASVPAATPAPTPAPMPTSHTGPVAAPPAAAVMPAVAMPDLPPAPPAPPRLTGVAIPAMIPPTPPLVPPPPPPAPPPAPGAPVAIAFPAASAILPAAGIATLRGMAQHRGARGIAVTGFGDATGDSIAAQIAALPLALDRARAVAASLYALGVPPAAVRIAALPSGGGAAARLVD